MNEEQLGLHERINLYERILHRNVLRGESLDAIKQKLSEWIEIARSAVDQKNFALARMWINCIDSDICEKLKK